MSPLASKILRNKSNDEQQIVKMMRHVRRFSSYAPPKGAGNNDSSSFVRLLGIAGVVGGAAYVYYDPDVLPEGLKRFLPIQGPMGHGMSLEEYEKWRSEQAGYLGDVVGETVDNMVDVAEAAVKVADEVLKQSEAEFRGTGNELVKQSKNALELLLAAARENEAGYIAELKAKRETLTLEDRMMLKMFKDEKARLKKEIKEFIDEATK